MRSSPMCLLLLLPWAAAADDLIDAPRFAEGDKWTYPRTVDKRPGGWVQTHGELTVTRVATMTIATSFHVVGAPSPPVERVGNPDWSRSRT